MKRRPAFTLVELLVVISIISLLVALLLPALRKARAAARQMGCLSNVRQQLIGMSMYHVDYDGIYPASPAAQYRIGDNRGFYSAGLLVTGSYLNFGSAPALERGLYCPGFIHDGVSSTVLGSWRPLVANNALVVQNGAQSNLSYVYRTVGQRNVNYGNPALENVYLSAGTGEWSAPRVAPIVMADLFFRESPAFTPHAWRFGNHEESGYNTGWYDGSGRFINFDFIGASSSTSGSILANHGNAANDRVNYNFWNWARDEYGQ